MPIALYYHKSIIITKPVHGSKVTVRNKYWITINNVRKQPKQETSSTHFVLSNPPIGITDRIHKMNVIKGVVVLSNLVKKSNSTLNCNLRKIRELPWLMLFEQHAQCRHAQIVCTTLAYVIVLLLRRWIILVNSVHRAGGRNFPCGPCSTLKIRIERKRNNNNERMERDKNRKDHE
jgi:hypothetical protein